MENFIFSINVTLPLFIMIAFGYKPAGFIFKALYSAKDFAKYMKKKIEKSLNEKEK